MKYKITLLSVLLILLMAGCIFSGNRGETAGNDSSAVAPEVSVRFSGVRPYYVNGKLDREVTYLNGVRNGMTKTYYASGGVKQVFIYEKGLRTDTALWFYEDGKLFRSTPYVRDTIHGTQVQYYRNGRIKATMGYNMGLRYPDLEEYYENGKMKVSNREIRYWTKDEYSERGVYTIFVEMDNKNPAVVFYKADYQDGTFNPAGTDKLNTSGGVGFYELTRSQAGNRGYIGIIAEYVSDFGNRNYVYKRIAIPYRDIN